MFAGTDTRTAPTWTETWSSPGSKTRTLISVSLSTSGKVFRDLSFFRDFIRTCSREVTGYVLISHVDVRKIVLPSLQIVRGRTLFKLNVQDDEFALIVTLSKMHNLEMPALRGKPAPSTAILPYFPLLGATSPVGIVGVSCGPSDHQCKPPPPHHHTCPPVGNHEGWSVGKNWARKR